MARCESHLVIPVLETGSESTAQQQPQPQQQQQQFKTEKSFTVEFLTKGEEQEELLQLSLKQQQQLQPPVAPSPVWKSQLVIPMIETGSERTPQQQPQGSRSSLRRGRGDGSKIWL